MSDPTTQIQALDQALASHDLYADPERMHATFARLRREDPLHWTQPVGHPPFWAVSKHADIIEIGKHPQVFIAEPKSFMRDDEEVRISRAETAATGGKYVRTIIHMDDPDHKQYRGLTQAFFMPANIKRLDAIIQERARRLVDRLLEFDGHCDFHGQIAVWYPLQIIMTLLGVPDSDHPYLLKLTQQFLAPKDPTLRRDSAEAQYKGAVTKEYMAFFRKLLQARRAQPTDDLASLIANSEIDGAPIGEMEALSYYVIMATAGHDTTSSSMGSGLYNLLREPGAFDDLRARPELLPSAIEEMFRFATPAKHFVRTATQDFVLRGKTIRAGDEATLLYHSANFDEEVFDDARRFRIDRKPNRQIAFGSGIHACLGQNLARATMRAFFTELLVRLDSIELDGEPEYIASNQVGGLKKLNIRYTPARHLA
ncbi:MAG: cytochrome P450 [Janthinobacterium lividum]